MNYKGHHFWQTQTEPPSASDARATEFRPAPTQELQSGEKLLVEAYAAIWVILFVFLLLSWRRQKRIDERVEALQTALERARGTAPGGTKARSAEGGG